MNVDRQLLTQALALAKHVAGAIRTTIPILSYVHITPGQDEVRFQATNLEQSVNLSLPAESIPGLSFCAPISKLLEFVKALPKATKRVDLVLSVPDAASNHHLAVNGTAKLPTLAPDDFPVVAAPAEYVESAFDLEHAARAGAVKSHDESRYAITAVLVDPPRGVYCGTDGHRLHLATYKPNPKGTPVLVLGAAFDLLLTTAVKKLGVPTSIRVSPTTVTFPLGYGFLTSRVPEGTTFPNYEQVVPKEGAAVGCLRMTKSLFREAVERTKPFWERQAPVTLDLDPDRPALHADHPDHGTLEFELAAEYGLIERPESEEQTVVNPIIPFGINARYLLDALDALPGEKIRFFVKDALSPCSITDERQAVTCVIMPMRMDYKGYRATQQASQDEKAA